MDAPLSSTRSTPPISISSNASLTVNRPYSCGHTLHIKTNFQAAAGALCMSATGTMIWRQLLGACGILRPTTSKWCSTSHDTQGRDACDSPGHYLVASGEGFVSAGPPQLTKRVNDACREVNGIAALVLHKQAIAQEGQVHLTLLPRYRPSPLPCDNAGHLHIVCTKMLS